MKLLSVPENIQSFWNDFLRENPTETDYAFYEYFHFDVSESAAAELLDLVLQKRKTATASLGWLMEANDKPLPSVGSLSVITNWHKEPRCVIRTESVLTLPFCDVPETFARAEGEGDGTLAYWREVHWAYFSKLCESLGREPNEKMPVVCEEFELVYWKRDTDAA